MSQPTQPGTPLRQAIADEIRRPLSLLVADESDLADCVALLTGLVLDAVVTRGWRPEWQTLRTVADECDTIRDGAEVGEFVPTATAWMRHRADQAEARAAEEPLEQVEGREDPDGD